MFELRACFKLGQLCPNRELGSKTRLHEMCLVICTVVIAWASVYRTTHDHHPPRGASYSRCFSELVVPHCSHQLLQPRLCMSVAILAVPPCLRDSEMCLLVSPPFGALKIFNDAVRYVFHTIFFWRPWDISFFGVVLRSEAKALHASPFFFGTSSETYLDMLHHNLGSSSAVYYRMLHHGSSSEVAELHASPYPCSQWPSNRRYDDSRSLVKT